MLMIIFWCLIAKLASVCDGCDVGTSEVNSFDWNQFTDLRTWYAIWHSPKDFENNVECFVLNVGIPEGNTSLLTVNFLLINTQHTLYGNATNWNGTGYDQVIETMPMWSGRISFIAIDYDRYAIAKLCPVNSTKPVVYVAYRSKEPDENTSNEVWKILQENGINVTQLEAFPTDHCN